MIAMLPVFLSIRPMLLRDGSPRPSLSDAPEYIERGRFRIHFTRTGEDAVEDVDLDANGLPDLIDEFVVGLIEGEREYLLEGWRPLANDTGDGGSTTIDVYVHPLDAYGYATAIPPSAGGAGAMGGSSCFIEFDESIQLTGGVARSVAKHELHHCVEFRYSSTATIWLYEAAATYEQYTHVTDPVLDYALGVLWSERLAEPERKLGDSSGRFEYAAFLWMKYWSEAGGFEPHRLIDLWEAIGEGEPWQEPLERESNAHFGRDLGSTYLEHALWNSFACAADDGNHYLPDILTCVADVTVPITPWDGSSVDITLEEGPFASTYLEMPSTGETVAVSCSGTAGLRYALVSVDAQGRALSEVKDAGLPIQVPTAAGGTVRLVVAGTEEEPLAATCRQVEPQLSTSGPMGCATAPAPHVWGLGALLLFMRRQSSGQASRKPTVSSSVTGRM